MLVKVHIKDSSYVLNFDEDTLKTDIPIKVDEFVKNKIFYSYTWEIIDEDK